MEVCVTAMQVELHYSAGTGHDWVLRFRRNDRCGAINAVFRWLEREEMFGVKEFGVFIAAILHDAMEQKVFSQETYNLVEKLIYAIPKTDLRYEQQVNLMRIVLNTALESGE